MPTTDDEEAPVDPRTIPRGAEVRLPPGARLPSGARPRPRPRRAEEGAPSGALEALRVADEAPGEVPYHVALERSSGGPGSYELRFKVGDLVECRCGPTDYIPATVVQLWYQDTEEDNEGMPSWYPRQWNPYQCRLYTGELVKAPIDHDNMIRAGKKPKRQSLIRPHIIRKNDGLTEEAIAQCIGDSPCCTTPDCQCSDGPMAIWRQKGGQDVFLGVVRYSSLDLLDEGSVVAGTHSKWTFVKLDDPDGPLDGPGHVISDEEFFPEMLLCDGQRNRRKHLLFVDDFTSFRDKDETKLRELERVGMAYGDLQIDAIFPFDERENGVLQAHVRADDRVKVLLEVVKPFRELMKLSGQPQPPPDDPRFDVPRPGTERQWMRVVAVTTDGMVVAWPRPSGPDGTRDTFMFKPRIRYDKMVYFPADNIMCMMRGENW